jgi:hypothetical protein
MNNISYAWGNEVLFSENKEKSFRVRIAIKSVLKEFLQIIIKLILLEENR